MRKNTAILLCIMSAVLSGCSEKISSTTGGNDSFMAESYNPLSEEILKSDTENIELSDAKLDVPNGFNYKLPALEVYLRAFTSAEVSEVLGMDTKGITPNQTNITMYGKIYSNTILFDGKNDLVTSYMIYYQTEKGQVYSYLFDKELFSERVDLGFQDEEFVKQEVTRKLKDLGLEEFIFHTVYYMDYKKLSSVEKEKEKDKYFQEDLESGRIPYKGEWREDEGCYVFDISFAKNQIPVQVNDYLVDDTFLMLGNFLRVFYSKDGIVEFDLSAYYDLAGEGETVEILKPENVVTQIENKFHSAIITDKIEITKMNLEYRPKRTKLDGNYMVLWPAWAVTYTQGNSREENIVYFDAENGKEIIY